MDDSSGGGDGIDGKSERTKVRSHGTPGSLGPALVEAHSPSPTCNSDLGSSHASFMLHVKDFVSRASSVPLPILIFALQPSPLSRFLVPFPLKLSHGHGVRRRLRGGCKRITSQFHNLRTYWLDSFARLYAGF